MIHTIHNLENVSEYTKYLISLSLNFHPDEDFENYVNYKTGENTFSKSEATSHNALMNKCFSICEKEEVDIYNYMLDIVLVETGMIQYIPGTSETY